MLISFFFFCVHLCAFCDPLSPDVSGARCVGRADHRVADHRVALHIAASTVTIPADTATCDALIVTFADAVIVMPLASILIELPLLSMISTAPGPSFNVSF